MTEHRRCRSFSRLAKTTQCLRALAGENVEDALERVAATGALERSRALALEYSEQARAALDGEADRDALEALTYAVVDREH